MDKNDKIAPVPVSGGMAASTKAKMQAGRAKHNAMLNDLTAEKRHAYKLCASAITTIEMVQRKLLRGQPVMSEFLQSIGTLQSYGAGML